MGKPPPPLRATEKIVVLFVAANPEGTEYLNIGEECRQIRQSIACGPRGDSIEVHHALAARPDDLRRELRAVRPHVLHFSGHGSDDPPGLLFESENGSPVRVAGEAMAELLTILKDNVRLVVLNACYSEDQASALRATVDCVIGMSRAVLDPDAIIFSKALYESLAHGDSVDKAFRLACNAIKIQPRKHSPTQVSQFPALVPQLLCKEGVEAATVNLLTARSETVVRGVVQKRRNRSVVQKRPKRSGPSPFAGQWLQLKKHAGKSDMPRPYAIVDIAEPHEGHFHISGTSYYANGDIGVTWPERLDLAVRVKDDLLVHCFEARHEGSRAIGYTQFEVPPTPPSTGPWTGEGRYAQQVSGDRFGPLSAEFRLVKLDRHVVEYYTGVPSDRFEMAGAETSNTFKLENTDIPQFICNVHREASMRRVILTGGTHAGKSTVLKRLQELGQCVLREAALEVITEGEAKHGAEAFLTRREANPEDFQKSVFDTHRLNERMCRLPEVGKYLFLDRSGTDCLVYLERAGCKPSIAQQYYAHLLNPIAVFVLDTISDGFKLRPGRTSDVYQSKRDTENLRHTYARFRCNPITVAANLNLDERVAFILEELDRLSRRRR